MPILVIKKFKRGIFDVSKEFKIGNINMNESFCIDNFHKLFNIGKDRKSIFKH